MGTAVAGLGANRKILSSSNTKTKTIVFMTVFSVMLGFGILIPIQPFFAMSFGANPAVITLLGASYSLMQFLFVPLWGVISDRYGRRLVMCISIATSAVGFFLFAFAESMIWLFLSRMISGLGGANIGCAQAIIADISDKKERTKGMGMIGAAMGLGFIVGPALGGILGQNGFMLPALVAGGLTLINLLCAFMFLKETNRTSHHTPNFKIVLEAKSYQNMTVLFLLSFLLIMAFSLFEQTIGIYLNDQLADSRTIYTLSIQRTAVFLALIAITSAVNQLTLLKKLSLLWGEKRLLIVGSLMACVAMALLPLIASAKVFLWLLFPGALFAVGLSVCLPSVSSIISQTVNDDEQGSFLGKSQSYSALGRVIGPAGCGMLFELSPHLPLFVASFLMFICFLLARMLK